MEKSTDVEEFITIVPVGESKPAECDPGFVTVLTVGDVTGAAEVIVHRPKGARLGLGLKFEGGSAASENVRRLLVQSCAEDSPAAKACAPWGKLIPGDEILAIDGMPVFNLTRIDCVRRLKESDEKLKLLIRHFDSDQKMSSQSSSEKEVPHTNGCLDDIPRPTTLPPPVPPRKLGKKNSFKDKSNLQIAGEPSIDKHVENSANNHQQMTNSRPTNLSRKSSFDSHLFRQSKEGLTCLKKGSPEEVRRLVRRLSDGKTIPPEAEVYLDLLSNEWERCLALADGESDDTGSSISTVIDRLGSMANSVENSIPSTPIMQQKSIDLKKVLNSIENIDNSIFRDTIGNKKIIEQMYMYEACKKLENSESKNIVASENINSIEESRKIQNFQKSEDNNNNSIKENDLKLEPKQENEIKCVENGDTEVLLVKPKPMPRNTKVERSMSDRRRRPLPIPEASLPSTPDQLLTPTKKNCIETWLQRSEAEMNNKIVEKFEEVAVPEILPRLIDFVPKTQFTEVTNETKSCPRPTSAPPPPPVETREDGSGASLDTIGELDESCDVTDNTKPCNENDTKERKSSDKAYWNERISRSDIEEKSLSNDETPVPTCPRQPPDGVETPSETIEKVPELPKRLPPRVPGSWLSTRPRPSYKSRSQDARSEASVKDKIAMFSIDLVGSTDRIDKCGSVPMRSNSTIRKSVTPCVKNYSDITSLDRRLTKSQDNLDETPRSYNRLSKRPEAVGGIEHSPVEVKSITTKSKLQNVPQKPLFYGSTTALATETSYARPIFHSRSISDDNSTKNVESHKSNLEYLIEQRKKSMSKLRGLAIPEVQAPIVDLPEIKVKDSISKSFLQKLPYPEIKRESKVNSKPISFNENKWNTNFLPNNIPKYSPAFKRKSLQVYTPSCLSKESTPERKFAEKVEAISKMKSNISLQKPLKTTPDLSRASYLNSSPIYKQNNKSKLNNIQDYKNFEIKICTATEVVDSDNDSAMSSTQSSYRSSASSPMHTHDNLESDSSRLSPRVSHYSTYLHSKSEYLAKPVNICSNGDECVKRKICRSMSSDTNISLSSSAGSAATSGSQASCSSLESSVADSEKRKVSKTYNVDTLNRRNILASAKCRSGRDTNLKSPVIEAKFSHESRSRTPSPPNILSERLSTLPTSGSAIANKGENRRRSKVLIESDSDSDNDVNIRQRKPDFKNSRLKRNSSYKGRQNGTSNENERHDEVPQAIKDKILKEINKAGLDDFDGSINKVAVKSSKSAAESNNVPKNGEKVEVIIESINNVKCTNVKVNSINGVVNGLKPTQLSKPSFCSSKSNDLNISTKCFRLMKSNGSGIGLILAGGIDCEAKDVTVHRVLSDSVAAKAGIKKGTKVRSINGNTMAGLTHAQSVSILKEQRPEILIEIEDEPRGFKDSCSDNEPTSLESSDLNSCDRNATGSIVTVSLEKAGGGAGLGFGLDGGRDSPNGDRPLTIKKLFAGGAAARSGQVMVGAELLSAGGQSFEGFTRTQAWAALKALPNGQVVLVLKNPMEVVS
ncbi:uncharacterized protein LOC126966380 isoform X2 [Leptidea sinapis]|uniref:uncharacterized protein LOC126966380 isoform X2 n=1 Tax=Leptidea sinapis TaxID=189913 RepID=UPI002130D05C|nr:uncharacterized protein LOC126966380 isoform X2 [Leptidea sinapis]